MRAGGWMPAPATTTLILRRYVEFAPLPVFLRTANCQGVSEREQEDDVAKVKAETRAATVLRFKCFLLSFHPSLSLAQITLSLLCQRALRSLHPLPLLSRLSVCRYSAACKYLFGNGNSSVTSSKHRRRGGQVRRGERAEGKSPARVKRQ